MREDWWLPTHHGGLLAAEICRSLQVLVGKVLGWVWVGDMQYLSWGSTAQRILWILRYAAKKCSVKFRRIKSSGQVPFCTPSLKFLLLRCETCLRLRINGPYLRILSRYSRGCILSWQGSSFLPLAFSFPWFLQFTKLWLLVFTQSIYCSCLKSYGNYPHHQHLCGTAVMIFPSTKSSDISAVTRFPICIMVTGILKETITCGFWFGLL